MLNFELVLKGMIVLLVAAASVAGQQFSVGTIDFYGLGDLRAQDARGRSRSRRATSCRSTASGRVSSPRRSAAGGPPGRAGRARACRLLRGRQGDGLRRRRARWSAELRVSSSTEGRSAPAGGRRAGRRSVRRCDGGGSRPRGRRRRRLAGTRALSRSGDAGDPGALRALRRARSTLLHQVLRESSDGEHPRWPHR